MKTLNKTASHILSRLIDAMNGKPHLKIESEPFMPLTIERIGEAINTLYGQGLPFSLCHYYEQNGDLMQDPEMCFVVIDNREVEKQPDQPLIAIPYMFQQANIGIYQESMSIDYGNLIMADSAQQAEHTYFANLWLANIRAQGFVKCDNDENTVQFSD